MSYITYQNKMLQSGNKYVSKIAAPIVSGVINFQTLSDKIEFASQPDVTGNKTFTTNLFIGSSASEMQIGLMNASNDFLFISYTISADTGANKVLTVNTKNSPPGVIRQYYNIDSYLNQIITLEIIKTSSSITSVKINNNTLTKIGDGYFNNGGSSLKTIAGQYYSIWDVEIAGVAQWVGYPNGNTSGAWEDTIGSNDGTVSGFSTTRNLF